MNDLPTKIIVVNDEDWMLELFEIMLRDFLKNVTVLSLQNSRTAWHVLSRTAPELLITDDKMGEINEINGEEICLRLLARHFTYPIIVTSGWPLTERWVRECAERGLNVRLLRCPFCEPELRRVVNASLESPCSRIEKRKKDSP